MVYGAIINDDAYNCLNHYYNTTVNPVIVTDPPFNIGYHYRTYRDKKNADEYFSELAELLHDKTCVIVHYPESLHRLSIEMGRVPDRVCSWVYPSNTPRQHRDIAFYGISPDFNQVLRPYKNPNDKRIKELMKKRTVARSYDWLEVNQVKNVSKEKTSHPCQMPLEVMLSVIGWLPKDSTIIDPFAGSGTTCAAAAKLGYQWIAIEIDSEYCEIIKERVLTLHT